MIDRQKDKGKERGSLKKNSKEKKTKHKKWPIGEKRENVSDV